MSALDTAEWLSFMALLIAMVITASGFLVWLTMVLVMTGLHGLTGGVPAMRWYLRKVWG